MQPITPSLPGIPGITSLPDQQIRVPGPQNRRGFDSMPPYQDSEREFNTNERSPFRRMFDIVLYIAALGIFIGITLLGVNFAVNIAQRGEMKDRELFSVSKLKKITVSVLHNALKNLRRVKETLSSSGSSLIHVLFDPKESYKPYSDQAYTIDFVYNKIKAYLENWMRSTNNPANENPSTSVVNLFGLIEIKRRRSQCASPKSCCKRSTKKIGPVTCKRRVRKKCTKYAIEKKRTNSSPCFLFGLCKMIFKSWNNVFELLSF